MTELYYINNIKELLFLTTPQSIFESHIAELLTHVEQNSQHMWYNIDYINTFLELFFIYFKEMKNPLVVFYALFVSISDSNIAIEPFIKKGTKLLENYPEFIYNDLSIYPEDFEMFNSLKNYCAFIAIPTQNKSVLFSGLSIETERGLSFKFKGEIDKSKLVTYVSSVLETMTHRYELIQNPKIKNLYKHKIDFILKEYKNFKVK